MYDLKNLKNITINDIPHEWIYKNYYEKHSGNPIHQPFDGRLVRVRSLKSTDTNPSLYFFSKGNKYYWRDFSNGIGGGAISFIEYCTGKKKDHSMLTAVADYTRFIENGGEYSPESYNTRPWIKKIFTPKVCSYTRSHLEFWSEYKVQMKTLIRRSIFAGLGYTVTDIYGENKREIISFCFSFNGKNDVVYQIYQPGNKKAKYINVDTNHLRGSDLLEGKHETCAIVSGIKDMVCMDELDLSIEYVAPMSETTLIEPHEISILKLKYKNIVVMLDNDEVGIKMMRVYQEKYGIKPVLIRLQKDLAENSRTHHRDYLREHYTLSINNVINGK